MSSKLCDRCQETSKIMYRVQWQNEALSRQDAPRTEQFQQQLWVFICPSCWPIVSLDNPHYRYGGTWKQRKK